jgi:hypothetical protein
MEVLIAIWIGACFLAAYVANEKQRSFWVWLGVSALLSPLFGLLALCALPKQENKESEPVSERELMIARASYRPAGYEVK